MENVLPCPFCGSERIGWSYRGQPATMGYLGCYTCDARIGIPSDSAAGGTIDFEKLIEKWNTRAKEDN